MKALHLTRPHAIMMVGIPGSGKSFFAKQFAETFATPYLDLELIQQYASNSASTEKLVLYFLNEVTKTKETFIFEGNSGSRTSRNEFAKWARAKGYHPLFVWVQTDPVTSRSRARKSNGTSHEQFDAYLRQFSSPHPDEKAVVLSGRHTYATQAKVVLGHLSKENREKAVLSRLERSAPVQKNATRNIPIQ